MAILKDFTFHSPESMAGAQAVLNKSKKPLLLAGGTFALNYLKKTANYPSDVISLKKIESLYGIKEKPKDIWIGSMVTVSALLESELILSYFPSFFSACQKMATTPVRNMATVGGNIASRFYWVDLPAVLMSLGAKIALATKTKKEVVSLEEFLSARPEKKAIITGVILPKHKTESFYFRHTKTVQEVDIPSLGVAFSSVRNGSRLSLSRCIVNTTVSFPVALKNVEYIFNHTESGKISIESLNSALCDDLNNSKLDEYRRHLLSVDLQDLLRFLNP